MLHPTIVNRDRARRVGTAVGVPIASFFIVLYAAPIWMLTQLTGGRVDVSWAVYTEEFRAFRLPLLITLMSAELALFVFVAVRGWWSATTRRIDLGFSAAIVMLMVSFILGGAIFESHTANEMARQWLWVPVLICAPAVAYQLFREFVWPRTQGAAQPRWS